MTSTTPTSASSPSAFYSGTPPNNLAKPTTCPSLSSTSTSHSPSPIEDYHTTQKTIEHLFAVAKAEAKWKAQRGQDLDEHLALIEQFGWKIKKCDYLGFWSPFWGKERGYEDVRENGVVLVRQISREIL